MMMDPDREFCVICSSVIIKGNDKVEDDEKVEGKTSLLVLSKLLLKPSPESGPVNQILEATLKSLGCAKFGLCADCNTVALGAVESKSRAEKIELEVSNLQLKLLELLRGLQEEMEVFQQEMSKMEAIIVNKSAPDEVERETADRDNANEKAVIVREEILEVVTELRFYQADLQDKLILNRVEDQTMLEVSCDEVEVEVGSEVKIENEESCNVDDLIGFGINGLEDEKLDEAYDTVMDSNEIEEGEENETGNENQIRYVGHVVGMETEEDEPAAKANGKRRNLRRQFGWKEDLPFMCGICGEGISTQNKLTRHLNRVHGQIPGAEKAERLKRPAVRYNNEAVSEEILSKALVCMTRNVDDKDRNSKMRKQERHEKMVALRQQWKALRKLNSRKDIKQQLNLTKMKTESKARQKLKSPKRKYVKKIRKTETRSGKSFSEAVAMTVAKAVENAVNLAVKEVMMSKPPPPLSSKVVEKEKETPKMKKKMKEQRPPLRRSTRGRCTLDMKEILALVDEKKPKIAPIQITPETET